MPTGILLVNLGTPDAPTAAAVRRYLAEFLADRRVVELPRLLWLPLLWGLILPLRSPRVARNYAKIWLPEGSPLRVYTQRIAAALETALGCPAVAGFRYGRPALMAGMQELSTRGCDEIIVLPLYPQFSATTTATVLDAVAAGYRRKRDIPGLQFIRAYPVDPGFIGALAASVRRHWERQGRGQRLLLSFHGLPEVNVERGDPYLEHCTATAEALAAALELGPDDWAMAFQSRFGKQEWLKPYAEPLLAEWARGGLKTVDVICPGFPVDCLETLEEIRLGAAETFRAAGGDTLHYIPALNDSPEHIEALAAMLRPRLAPPPNAKSP